MRVNWAVETAVAAQSLTAVGETGLGGQGGKIERNQLGKVYIRGFGAEPADLSGSRRRFYLAAFTTSLSNLF
jgi:nicotinamide mononucleotide (NMN) deamidase PncC